MEDKVIIIDEACWLRLRPPIPKRRPMFLMPIMPKPEVIEELRKLAIDRAKERG